MRDEGAARLLKYVLRLLVFAVPLAALGACQANTEVFGKYYSSGVDAGEATLELMKPNGYRFCFAGECTNGSFQIVWQPNKYEGRLRFYGERIDNFFHDVSETGLSDLPEYVTRRWGFSESNYWLLPITYIDIDSGRDAYFFRR